jgi:AcrR family transcriptional regulator
MPRAGLTPDLIVAEAARLADEVGFEGVTLAVLAARFGVAVPSLYKHIAGIDDVRRRLAIRSVREFGRALEEAIAAAPAAKSRDRAAGQADRLTVLLAMADGYRGYARAHPGRYASSVRAPEPGDAEHRDANAAVLATAFAVLDRYGLAGDDAIDAARALRAALHGFIALEAAGGFGLPRDVERSYHRLVHGLHHALSAWRQFTPGHPGGFAG